ncbi:MAG: hypothetical protein ACTSVI_17240 [Promethearchaeota archaeon]
MSTTEKDKEKTSEKAEKRVGVFVCNCGINIAGVVDCPNVMEYAKGLEGVVYSETHLSYCTESGAQSIQKAIEENNLDAIVIAA